MSQRLATCTLGLFWSLDWLSAILADRPDDIKNAPVFLRQRIDKLIGVGQRQSKGQRAAICSDGAFLRRIYLDLTGTIPTVDQARSFLNDFMGSQTNERQSMAVIYYESLFVTAANLEKPANGRRGICSAI